MLTRIQKEYDASWCNPNLDRIFPVISFRETQWPVTIPTPSSRVNAAGNGLWKVIERPLWSVLKPMRTRFWALSLRESEDRPAKVLGNLDLES